MKKIVFLFKKRWGAMPARPRHLFLTSPYLIISQILHFNHPFFVVSMSQAETRESIEERREDDKKTKSRRPASKSSSP
jgi:hypothetical protein